MDARIPDPREPDVTIATGGAGWPTPGEIRAELPPEALAEFEDEYGRALEYARVRGDLAPLAHVLGPWQRRLQHVRAGVFDEILERARAVRAGEDVGAIRAERLRGTERLRAAESPRAAGCLEAAECPHGAECSGPEHAAPLRDAECRHDAERLRDAERLQDAER